MLKKLVKYGNSNALVLDKALLELLNITEGSVVKIKTDGTSLIVTPQNNGSQQGTIMPTITPQDALNNAVEQNMAQYYKNPENAQEYMNELRKVFGRYANDIKKLDLLPEYQQEVLEIDQYFKGDRLDPRYGKAELALRHKYAPELIKMDQEIQALVKKYSAGQYRASDLETGGSFTFAMANFKRVHEKYRYVQELVMKLNENPEYINESVMLAEKYQVTKNSPEYIKEYNQLIAKYVPDYAQYQEELKTVGEIVK